MRLRKECEHGRYDPHVIWDDKGTTDEMCPGGEFLADDALVIEKLAEAKQRATHVLAAGYAHPDDIEAMRETIQEVLDALTVRKGAG